MKRCLFVLVMIPALTASAGAADAARPANKHYVVNHEPLRQTALVHLPAGAIKARGWLRDQLRVEADGLASYLWSAFPAPRPTPTRPITRKASWRWPWCLATTRG